METKRCSKCKETKPISMFSRDKRRKDGYQSWCKACHIKYDVEYYQSNKSKIAVVKVEYRRSNKDKIAEYDAEYRRSKKDEIAIVKAKYRRNRRESDPLFKFSCDVRALILGSFKRNKTNNFKKNTKTEALLGCTIVQLQEHLAKQFLPGMSLENHGEWHIDHIIPLAQAKTQQEVVKLNHYTNLQPLWATDNLKKGSRVI